MPTGNTFQFFKEISFLNLQNTITNSFSVENNPAFESAQETSILSIILKEQSKNVDLKMK